MRGGNGNGTAVSVGLLVLRAGAGAYLLTHGLGKLGMLLEWDVEKMGDPIGIGAGPSLVLITMAEFLGALGLILGLGTRFFALSIVIAMAVAAFVAHGDDPWTSATAFQRFFAGETKAPSSKEPALLYLIPALTLLITGAGAFSFDAWIAQWRRARRARPF